MENNNNEIKQQEQQEEEFLFPNFSFYLSFLTLLIGFIILFFIFKPSLTSKKKQKEFILILGSINSGKTFLTRKLAYQSEPETITSSKPSIIISKNLKYKLIDFPGHPKLRSQLNNYLEQTKKIIFVFDSSNTQSQLRDSAELLYDLFTNPNIDSCGRMLFVCNKSDVKGSRPHARVKMAIQEELEKIKKTRKSLEDGDDNANSVPLGRLDQRFTFEQDAPIEVFFTDCSAKNGDLSEIIEFIES